MRGTPPLIGNILTGSASPGTKTNHKSVMHSFLDFVSCREADSPESKVSNEGDKNLAGSYRRLSFICSFSGSWVLPQ